MSYKENTAVPGPSKAIDDSNGEHCGLDQPKVDNKLQNNEDAEFVEKVMRIDIACVSGVAEGCANSDVMMLGTKRDQPDKRKRDDDEDDNDDNDESDGSDDNVNTKEKLKYSKVQGKGKGKKAKKFKNCDQDYDNKSDRNGESFLASDSEDSDISRTLKALTILDEKIDRRFDEIRACNKDIKQSLQKEIQSVRKEFNDRLEGLAKKVENKVTETLQKSLDAKVKNARSELRKEISKDISREVGKDIKKANEKIGGIQKEIESIQETVGDVINHSAREGSRSTEDISRNIAIRNLPESENENTLNKVNALIKDGLNLRDAICIKAVRKQTRDSARNGVVIATCDTEASKREIMRSKQKLQNKRNYERVYIEYDRPRDQRNQISNLRALVQVVGRDKLHVRGSRIFVNNRDSEDTGHRSSHDERDNRPDRSRDTPGDRYRDNARDRFRDNLRDRSRYNRDNRNYATSTERHRERHENRQSQDENANMHRQRNDSSHQYRERSSR